MNERPAKEVIKTLNKTHWNSFENVSRLPASQSYLNQYNFIETLFCSNKAELHYLMMNLLLDLLMVPNVKGFFSVYCLLQECVCVTVRPSLQVCLSDVWLAAFMVWSLWWWRVFKHLWFSVFVWIVFDHLKIFHILLKLFQLLLYYLFRYPLVFVKCK